MPRMSLNCAVAPFALSARNRPKNTHAPPSFPPGPFPGGKKLQQGYAYILTHPGVPKIFWEHWADHGGQHSELRVIIDALVALRKRAGVHASSGMTILAAEPEMYVARIEGRRGQLTLKMGPKGEMGKLVPREEDGWAVGVYGHQFCVWLREN